MKSTENKNKLKYQNYNIADSVNLPYVFAVSVILLFRNYTYKQLRARCRQIIRFKNSLHDVIKLDN